MTAPRADELYITWARQFVLTNPVIFDKNNLWWLWNKKSHQFEETDETDLLNLFRVGQELGDRTVRERKNLIEALRLVAREYAPQELPAHIIQFRDKIFNIQTQETRSILNKEKRPKFFTTNTIPHPIGDSHETPTIDKLFGEWVGEKNIATLYELIAYCTYREYPIHIIAVLNGCGRNGKGSFLRVVEKFLGEKNLVSTDFERLIGNRFETYNLYRKLGAIMGETNFGTIKNTSLLKRLSGDDLIPFEKKGGATFNAHSYATILIATNSLPISEDETDGFYRRWLIIDFPNEFPEGKEISATIPEEEYAALARKITKVLPELLNKGKFTGHGTIRQRREKYIDASNPFVAFLKECCYTEDPNAHITRRKLYQAYLAYLDKRKQRKVTPKEFGKVLDATAIEWRRTTIDSEYDTYVFGVKLSESVNEFGQEKAFMQVMQEMHETSLSSPAYRAESDHLHIMHNLHTASEKVESESQLLELGYDGNGFCHFCKQNERELKHKLDGKYICYNCVKRGVNYYGIGCRGSE